MKINLPLLKLIIRLLILLILFVMLFLISAFLYSARYWKDVYNYITPNITIKHIPTVSEINLTDYDVDLTTELYASTTEYGDFYTIEEEDGLNFGSYNETAFDDQLLAFDRRPKPKRSTDEDVDYDLTNKTTVVDYFFDYDGEERKVGTGSKIFGNKLVKRALEDVDVFFEINETEPHCTETTGGPNGSCSSAVSNHSVSDVVFPWIAAVFVRNNNSNEFEYICDGAILSDRAILSAARCLGNATVDDILLLLGKRSLQNMAGNEVYRVSQANVHPNFTSTADNANNDLVILVPDKTLIYNSLIQEACMLSPQMKQEDIVDSITTGWQINGDLIDIHLETARNDTSCFKQPELDNVFCAAYDITKNTCPSYGGLHLVKTSSNMWYLDGILTEDTRQRGLCLHKSRRFTDLSRYTDWLPQPMSTV